MKGVPTRSRRQDAYRAGEAIIRIMLCQHHWFFTIWNASNGNHTAVGTHHANHERQLHAPIMAARDDVHERYFQHLIRLHRAPSQRALIFAAARSQANVCITQSLMRNDKSMAVTNNRPFSGLNAALWSTCRWVRCSGYPNPAARGYRSSHLPDGIAGAGKIIQALGRRSAAGRYSPLPSTATCS